MDEIYRHVLLVINFFIVLSECDIGFFAFGGVLLYSSSRNSIILFVLGLTVLLPDFLRYIFVLCELCWQLWSEIPKMADVWFRQVKLSKMQTITLHLNAIYMEVCYFE
jgi:hypothetical protein